MATTRHIYSKSELTNMQLYTSSICTQYCWKTALIENAEPELLYNIKNIAFQFSSRYKKSSSIEGPQGWSLDVGSSGFSMSHQNASQPSITMTKTNELPFPLLVAMEIHQLGILLGIRWVPHTSRDSISISGSMGKGERSWPDKDKGTMGTLTVKPQLSLRYQQRI